MKGRISSQAGEAGSIQHDFEEKVVIGRGTSCDLVLALPTVSGSHASVTYDPEQSAYMLEDLGSTHGTSLDGTPVSGRERLDHMNVISLAGGVDLLFQDLEKCAARHGPAQVGEKSTEQTSSAPSAPPKPPEPPPVTPPPPAAADGGEGSGTVIGQIIPPPAPVEAQADPPSESTVHAMATPPDLQQEAAGAGDEGERTTIGDPASGPAAPNLEAPSAEAGKGVALQRVRLVFSQAIEGERRYSLEPGENTIGRGVSSDVPRKRAEVSRNHAVITLRDGKIWLRDCGSSHGTQVNGNPVTDEIEISVGATISFGIDDAQLEAE